MPRRASLFVFLGFAVALVLVTGISAGAQSGEIRDKKAGVAAAQDRLMEMRMEVSAAQASYNNALYEMNQLNGQIAEAKDDLDGARERFKAAKKSLEERAALVYKSQNVGYMDVLIGVDSFSEFASRLDLWIRLLGRERADFVKVREAKEDLLARKDRLETEREQRFAAVERAMAQKERAEKAEAQAEAYLASLNADLRAAIEAAQDQRAEQAQAAAAAIVQPAPKPEKKDSKKDPEPAPESTPAPKPVPVAVPESQPEPIPEIDASRIKQVPVPKPDLSSEQAAADREAAAKAAAAEAKRLAEQRAAERKAAREAEEQAAAEQQAAERAARLAQQRAAKQEAREEAQRRAELAAERAAERRAAREEAERQAELAAQRAAIEEAAAEQAAAERAAARRAAERRAAERQAAREAQQAADASASASAAAAERAEERRAEKAAEASASASAAAAERAEARREARAAEEASASASSSASASAGSQNTGGGSRNDASASSSASASASSSAAPGGGGSSAMGGDVISVAMEHLGTPYVLSTPGPCTAFVAEDCSCFTMLVFQEFGIALPDSPGGQMGYGTPVSGAPQAGDLLFWSEDGSGYITHVGIAMGDGTTIHASNAAGEVTITDIGYINGYAGARRLL